MRSGWRWRLGGGVFGMVLCTAETARAGVPGFPAEQALVPVMVGAAFALPALVALVWSTAGRIWNRLGPGLAIGLLVLVALAAIAILQPSLLPRPGS